MSLDGRTDGGKHTQYVSKYIVFLHASYSPAGRLSLQFQIHVVTKQPIFRNWICRTAPSSLTENIIYIKNGTSQICHRWANCSGTIFGLMMLKSSVLLLAGINLWLPHYQKHMVNTNTKLYVQSNTTYDVVMSITGNRFRSYWPSSDQLQKS